MAIKLITPLTKLRVAWRVRLFRPILLIMFLLLCLGNGALYAQLMGSLSVSTKYSDNAFQLSDYDLNRWDADHHLLSFAETTDDVSIASSLELVYPINYRWWKISPSLKFDLNRNISNTEKYRNDIAAKLRVDRYYWYASAQYAYQPHIYFRDFSDNDGTDDLQNYTYSRDIYRADLGIKPLKNTSLKANIRKEVFSYNEYFTEADGDAIQGGVGIYHRFPMFSVDAGYDYRTFNNENLVDSDDASYDANIYHAKLTIPKMPISEQGKAMWQPSLSLNYQQRYYQGGGSWYGGRADYLYTMNAGFLWSLSSKIDLSLDYSHIFRSVESDNDDVLLLKEYGENRFGAELKYSF